MINTPYVCIIRYEIPNKVSILVNCLQDLKNLQARVKGDVELHKRDGAMVAADFVW